MKRWWIALIIAAALAAGSGVWYFWPKGNGQGTYRTAKIERGDLVQTVRATGTIQPIKLVQVGTQVNGPVKKLYVDYNDRVKEGDLVAQIDATVYEARLAQDEANLTQGMASIDEAKAKLLQAEKDLARSQELVRREMLSQADYDAALATRDTLAAQLKVVQAGVEQDKAALKLSRANLDYTTIRSPVNGVVISRNVDEGQTVVASMSAQVLFQIATDLEHVQAVASIPEADVGKIRVDQPVTFTVDAYDQDFHGKVSQIRLAAATVQNVVTYPIVILAENPDAKLFPGMTANIVCEVARQADVLKVPNAALRFKPADATKSADAAKAADTTKDADTRKTAGSSKGRSGSARRGAAVWIEGKTGPVSVAVTPGISDGAFTEVKDPTELRAGQDLIVGLADTSKPDQNTVNPFMPRAPSGGPRPR